MKAFASDNQAGAWPEVIAAIARCNGDHAMPYGQDPYTAEATDTIKRTLGATDVFFVYNGTAANVLCLAPMLARHEAVICASTAHLNIDECGAPERFLGCKLLLVDAPDGKLTPQAITHQLIRRGDQHFAQAKVVSITQPTEYGTVYSLQELAAIVALCKQHGLRLHIDGARIGNAAASLGCSLADICAGADAVSLGGTKAGLLFGEAVVFFDSALAKDFRYTRKQAMQLGSKGRFLGAQFATYVAHHRHYAEHANAMAQRLARALPATVRITQPVQANAVFAIVPRDAIKALMAHSHFYVWNEHSGEVRWMTSWDTQPEEVDAFAVHVAATLRAPPSSATTLK